MRFRIFDTSPATRTEPGNPPQAAQRSVPRPEGTAARALRVLALARADIDTVQLNGAGVVTGSERLTALFRDAIATPTGAGIALSNSSFGNATGEPTVSGRLISWCGIWAVDMWRRAGVDVQWKLGAGPVASDGTTFAKKSIGLHRQADLAGVKVGDIITIETVRTSWPGMTVPASMGRTVPKNANHHAIVTDIVRAQDGTIRGFNVVEGNAPSRHATGSANITAIHANFISAALISRGQDSVGNLYAKGITGYYSPPSVAATAPMEMASVEMAHRETALTTPVADPLQTKWLVSPGPAQSLPPSPRRHFIDFSAPE